MAQVWQALRRERINHIVSLTSLDEARHKSPDYAQAIADDSVPCNRFEFAIADYGVPEDRRAFCSLAEDVATRLRAGQRILVHCDAGIGRSGTLAICVLVTLGASLESGKRIASAAGASPVTPEQDELVAWYAGQLGEGK